MFADYLRNKTILVTGWAGFLWSHLCEKLLSYEAIVLCVDNMQTGQQDNVDLFLWNDRYSFFLWDCNIYDDLYPIFSSHTIDFVFHHAATVGVKLTNENPLWVLDDIKWTRNILDLSLDFWVEKVVFCSSSEVYGEPLRLPQHESDPVSPHIPYATVKLVGEQMMQAFYTKKWLRTTSLRFFNVYWPRQIGTAYGFVTGIFINQVLHDQSPTIFWDGSQTRNFVYVEDNVLATISALLSSDSDGEVINIGTGYPITVLELAEKIISLSGRTLSPVFVDAWDDKRVKHRFPDVSKMKTLLSYEPKFTLEEGLHLTIDWYRSRLF